MDQNAIRAQLDVIRHSTDLIEAQLDPITGPDVKPGDNLASIIEQAPANAVLTIDNAYVTAADLVFTKPITLQAYTPVPPGRISKDARVPTINGSMDASASPSVSCLGLALVGTNPNTQLLRMGDKFSWLQGIIAGSQQGQHRAIWADAKNQIVHDSYIYNIWLDIDTQAIWCYNGCDGLDVVNTYLEASGENFLAGGADASSANNIPKNISFDNCDFFKPLEWFNVHSVKNLFELKCAQKVTVKNSRFTNCWTSGQTGYGIVITVRNQDGAAPFSVIEDVLFDNNVIANVGAGFQFLGTDDTNPSGKQSRATFSNNKIQINTDLGAARQIAISHGSDQLKFLTNAFTYIGANEPNSFFNFDAPGILSTGFEFDGNDFQEGDYGIFGTGAPALGQVVLDMYAPGYVCNANTVHKGTSGRTIQYPPCITLV